MARADYIVCVPARNEAERLPRLLAALADQHVVGEIPVLIAVNNSSDGTVDLLRAARANYAGQLDITVDEQEFPARLAHAGSARRRAMDEGLKRLSGTGDGVLLSTDADARPPRGWIVANLSAIEAGAELVGGELRLDEEEPLGRGLQRQYGLLSRYWQEVRAIEDSIDPLPWDLPPRHGDHTGASLAITAAAYRKAGGVPIVPTGEDRMLVSAALAAGARLVHPLDVWVHVSARLEGRAVGGMASAMSALAEAAESGLGTLVPPLAAWEERARWRRALRSEPDGSRLIAMAEGALPPMPETLCLLSHYGPR